MKKQNKLVKISQSLLIVCLLTIGLTGIATCSSCESKNVSLMFEEE